ncbi:MAG: 4-alpha-glucanotransferase [Ruthenibacterium sp.]
MRAAGILMPVSSLPSPYGIGSLGKQAYDFVDFLAAAQQRYWQILPIGPTGYGDSPYQSFSAFAANPYFIDLDALVQDGLLTRAELAAADFGGETKTGVAGAIDYYKLYKNRKPLLEKAVARFVRASEPFDAFAASNADWLPDYALFMALKEENGMRALSFWPAPLRRRESAAMAAAQRRVKTQITFWEVVQYLFYRQWQQLKSYANAHGVQLIGDIPIYVSPDSSDLWADPSLFQVSADGALTEVAGCPPDAFSEDGQLWGNPLYDWPHHLATGCAWWVHRMQHASSVYDVVRIDHFRGFESYYAIPAGDATAVNGTWRKGPGEPLIDTLKTKLPGMRIIAEDLGYMTDGVRRLLAHSGFPGMKVLQFAFDSREESDYLPHNYHHNSVVYTGTHDNTTMEDWQYSAPAADVAFCKKYLDITKDRPFTRSCVRAALGSVADTCIIPLADWLALDKHARINTPATLGGNWQWRVDAALLTGALALEIADLTRMYGRAPEAPKKRKQ